MLCCPTQVEICHTGLTVLLDVARTSPHPLRRSVAADILSNIHSNAANTTAFYRRVLRHTWLVRAARESYLAQVVALCDHPTASMP